MTMEVQRWIVECSSAARLELRHKSYLEQRSVLYQSTTITACPFSPKCQRTLRSTCFQTTLLITAARSTWSSFTRPAVNLFTLHTPRALSTSARMTTLCLHAFVRKSLQRCVWISSMDSASKNTLGLLLRVVASVAAKLLHPSSRHKWLPPPCRDHPVEGQIHRHLRYPQRCHLQVSTLPRKLPQSQASNQFLCRTVRQQRQEPAKSPVLHHRAIPLRSRRVVDCQLFQ